MTTQSRGQKFALDRDRIGVTAPVPGPAMKGPCIHVNTPQHIAGTFNIQALVTAEVRRQVAALNRDCWGTADEAAEWARVSKSHFLLLCRQKRGPPSVGTGKFVRSRRSAVDRWLETKNLPGYGQSQLLNGRQSQAETNRNNAQREES